MQQNKHDISKSEKKQCIKKDDISIEKRTFNKYENLSFEKKMCIKKHENLLFEKKMCIKKHENLIFEKNVH